MPTNTDQSRQLPINVDNYRPTPIDVIVIINLNTNIKNVLFIGCYNIYFSMYTFQDLKKTSLLKIVILFIFFEVQI